MRIDLSQEPKQVATGVADATIEHRYDQMDICNVLISDYFVEAFELLMCFNISTSLFMRVNLYGPLEQNCACPKFVVTKKEII